ncbi:MAG: aminodeoxychorismate/anthranilate synthase component II [Chitinophagales bacterium]
MKILVLDNYDSFVYNLVHIIRALGYGGDMDIVRNDKIELEEVVQYDKILLSPGPGIPEEAGIMMDLIRKYAPTKSIMGVCLGHQAIGEVFGAKLVNMDEVLHGIATPNIVKDEDELLFEGVPNRFTVARYHSWMIDAETVTEELKVTAVDDENRVMGIRHREYDVRGVQFHPESVLTEHGVKIVENWLGAK